MRTYEVKMTATITIRATNAAAAKRALRNVRIISEAGGHCSPPSEHSPLDWHYEIDKEAPAFSMRHAHG